MKKLHILLLCLLIAVPFGQAISIDDLYRSFSKEKGVQSFHLNKFLTGILKLDPEFRELNLKELKMLDLEKCKPETQGQFTQKVNLFLNEASGKYQTDINATESDVSVYILTHRQEETILEFIVLTTGKECGLIAMKGSFKPEVLEKWLDDSDVDIPDSAPLSSQP